MWHYSTESFKVRNLYHLSRILIYMVLHATVPLTLPETNITPENRRLEDHTCLFWEGRFFSGAIYWYTFREVFFCFLERDPCSNEGGHERTSARSHRDFLRPGVRRAASAVFWNARKTQGEETNRRAVVALQGTSRFWMFFLLGY